MATFDKVSDEYKDKALVQQKAARKLLDLINIDSDEDVIDIACGPGHITKLLSEKTSGKVTGIDISVGMIREAAVSYPDIEFRVIAVQDLDYKNKFDVAFCNSSLQWFTEPDKCIRAICNSLKPGGRIGVSCPGTSDWAPWFRRIITEVAKRKEIGDIFSHWKSPWFHLPLKEDYNAFFERNGFKTVHLEIAYEEDYYPVEKAYDSYISGAANGFTGRAYYDIKITDDYINTFNCFAREEMARQSKDGKIKVDFNRMYYIGKK